MIQEALLEWQYQDTESGLVMPWFTLPTLQWLKKIGTEEWRVFEYGAGYSSAWWKVNSFFYSAVESEVKWARAFNASLSADKEDYINRVKDFQVNCIVVDGKWREECVEIAVKHLPKWGYLIIDNWDSEDFNPILVVKALQGWNIEIHQQPNHRTWKTAVLQKSHE